MVIIKQLNDAASIEDACALLHNRLIEQIGWNFLPKNPSQLRVEIRNNRHLLVDRFTDNAAWFGAFDDSMLVGCLRVTFVDENNKLEIDGYKNSQVIQEYLPENRSNCTEMTRIAILKNYSGLGILRSLCLAAFKYCDSNKYSICGAPSNVHVISLFKRIQFPLKMANAFKYEEQDPESVHFYFADQGKLEIKNMIMLLESLDKSRESACA